LAAIDHQENYLKSTSDALRAIRTGVVAADKSAA
jgi:hypothetical protein